MPQKILAGNWPEYHDRKKVYEDSRYFDSSIEWEVDFLTNRIISIYPLYSEELVRKAIDKCRHHLPIPYRRTSFVTCLMIMLKGDA